MDNPRLGIDLGGTKIEAIVLDRNQIRHRIRCDTPSGDYPATLAAISNLIDQIQKESGVEQALPLGIATPGAISLKTGLMKNCNSTCLNGQNLVADLQTVLNRPVRIANDADCFTLSEASDGAAQHAKSVFGVILGTGVGGGICYNQQLLEGVNAICGEWGHTTLPLAAIQNAAEVTGRRRCYCNRDNCVETWLSGPAFEQSYLNQTDTSLSAREIAALAEQGDKDARALLDQYSNMLALALSTVINILDPETIVLGGGMSNIDYLYARVPDYLPGYVFSDQVNTQILKARHGDSSGVRGAAWLWPQTG
jgi:predicted NBD/HSP70 family sugar kinase